MPAGLDVGAARIVAATTDGTDGARNAALAVERSDYVEDFLEGADTPSIETDDEIVALGDAASEVATIANDDPTRLLGANSALPVEDASTGVEVLVRTLVGDGEGSLRYVPPSGIDVGPLEEAVTALGYDPAPIDPGLAVLYDAMDQPYTGLGVVVDGTRTLATLVVEGVPVSRSELSRGGDWIDQEIASATGNDPDAVAELRANADLDDPTSGALALRYDTLLSNLALAIADESPAVDGPIPVVIGGVAAPTGIESRLADALDDVELPFAVDSIERADDPEHAAARGALVAAEDGGDVATDAEDADPEAAGFVTSLADEDGAAAALAGGGAGGAAVAGAEEGGADAAAPAPSGGTAAVESGGGGTAPERVADLRERLQRLENRLGVDDEQPLDEDVADLAQEVATLVALHDRVAELEEDLESELEAAEAGAEADGDADTVEAVREELDALDDEVAELRADVDDVGDRLQERADELEERLKDVPDAGRVETIESRLEALPPVADLADLVERVEAVDADDLSEVADSLGEQTESIESLEAATDELVSDVESLRERADEIEERAEDVEEKTEDLDGVADRVEDLSTSMEEAESSVSELAEDLEALEDGADEETIDALRERIDVVETAVEDVESEFDEAAGPGAVETVDERVDDVDERVGAVDDRVSDLEGEVPDPDLVDALSVDLEALRGRIEQLEESIEERFEFFEDDLDAIDADAADAEELAALDSDLVALEAAVEDAEDERGELDGAHDDLREEFDDAVAGLEADLENLEAQLEDGPEDAVDMTQHQNAITRFESRIDAVENSVAEAEANAASGAGRSAILVLGLGLAAVGGLGAALAFTTEQSALAGGFVGVPLVAVAIAWYLS